MKTLFLDIETSPNVVYSWDLYNVNIGLNQIIAPTRMICVAYRFKDGPMEFTAEWQGGRRKMVKEIHQAMNQADAVVHYNGASFDEKHLNREFVQAGLEPPAKYSTIDLYLTIKRKFRFAASKLAQVTDELEVRQGKIKTDFDLWRDTLDGDPDARALMEEYNCEDVELLVALYDQLLPWLDRHPNVALYEDGDVLCTRCGSGNVIKNGAYYTTAGKFQKYRCKDCFAESRSSRRLDTTELRPL